MRTPLAAQLTYFSLCTGVALCVADLRAQALTGITGGGKVVRVPEKVTHPWAQDVIKVVPPEYPYRDRARFNEGKGLFRALIDPKSGHVTRVVVVKSTGYRSLDEAASSALQQWRLRPGKWKVIEMPINYEMSRSRAEAMEKIRRARQEARRNNLPWYEFPEVRD